MLQPCGECGEEISSHAETCPRCGIGEPFLGEAERSLSAVAGDTHTFGSNLWALVKGILYLYLAWIIFSLSDGC